MGVPDNGNNPPNPDPASTGTSPVPPTTQVDGANADPDRPQAKLFTQEEVTKLIARETDKAKTKALQDKQKELDDAAALARGESERLLRESQEEVKNLQTENRRVRAQSSVSSKANAKNAIDPDAVYMLIRDQITFNDDGDPTNVDDLISALEKEKPRLFSGNAGTPPGDGGPRGKLTPARQFDDMVRQRAGFSTG